MRKNIQKQPGFLSGGLDVRRRSIFLSDSISPLTFYAEGASGFDRRNAMDTHAKPLEKALLVEDNDIMQKIHSLYLKELGFEVDLADTGYKALELAAQQDYHCIL